MTLLLTPGGRLYDSKIGRFLSRDPLGGREGGYLYCDNDPVSHADPSGLKKENKQSSGVVTSTSFFGEEALIRRLGHSYGVEGIALLRFAKLNGFTTIADDKALGSPPWYYSKDRRDWPSQILYPKGYEERRKKKGWRRGVILIRTHYPTRTGSSLRFDRDDSVDFSIVYKGGGPLSLDAQTEELYRMLVEIYKHYEEKRRKWKESRLILKTYGEGVLGQLMHVVIQGFGAFGIKNIEEGFMGTDITETVTFTLTECVFKVAWGGLELFLTATAIAGVGKLAAKAGPKAFKWTYKVTTRKAARAAQEAAKRAATPASAGGSAASIRPGDIAKMVVPERARLLARAGESFRGGLTHAGRGLMKHPNIVGARDAAALTRMYGNNAGINRAASKALRKIMDTGTQTVRQTTAFGRVVEFKLPSGLGARFSADTAELICFLGRGL